MYTYIGIKSQKHNTSSTSARSIKELSWDHHWKCEMIKRITRHLFQKVDFKDDYSLQITRILVVVNVHSLLSVWVHAHCCIHAYNDSFKCYCHPLFCVDNVCLINNTSGFARFARFTHLARFARFSCSERGFRSLRSLNHRA